MDPLSTRMPDLTTTAVPLQHNSTNSSDCPESDAWDILYSSGPVYILLVTVLGIVFNLFVLMIFCLHKKACTVAEIYLSNLAAADLLLVSCLPFWAINILNQFNWPFGLFLCKVVSAGIKMNMYCSIYFLVLVSMDRYVALVHTMSHGRLRRPKYAKISVLLVWCLGLLLTIPEMVFRSIDHFPEHDVIACWLAYPSPHLRLFLDGLLVVLSFMVPIIIISFCTYKIIQALKNQPMERFNAEKTENKATQLILAVLLAFLICWVPFHIVTTLDVFLRVTEVDLPCDVHTAMDICNQIFTYLGFFNSVLNPILYVIVGKNFRKKIREVFRQFAMKQTSTDSTRSHLSSTQKTSV